MPALIDFYCCFLTTNPQSADGCCWLHLWACVLDGRSGPGLVWSGFVWCLGLNGGLYRAGNVPSPNAPLKRMLAYTGCFSRMATIKDIHLYLSQRLRIKEEDMRLWLYNSEVSRDHSETPCSVFRDRPEILSKFNAKGKYNEMLYWSLYHFKLLFFINSVMLLLLC